MCQKERKVSGPCHWIMSPPPHHGGGKEGEGLRFREGPEARKGVTGAKGRVNGKKKGGKLSEEVKVTSVRVSTSKKRNMGWWGTRLHSDGGLQGRMTLGTLSHLGGRKEKEGRSERGRGKKARRYGFLQTLKGVLRVIIVRVHWGETKYQKGNEDLVKSRKCKLGEGHIPGENSE